jgi:hypothetical protein
MGQLIDSLIMMMMMMMMVMMTDEDDDDIRLRGHVETMFIAWRKKEKL